MGNRLGREKGKANIIQIDEAQTKFKINIPTKAMDLLLSYPSGYVLLDSKAVRRYGIRAPRLQPEDQLKPGKYYFLVQMPRFPEPESRIPKSFPHDSAVNVGSGSGPVRVKMRLPRAEIEKLMGESIDETEVVDRILDFCLQNSFPYRVN